MQDTDENSYVKLLKLFTNKHTCELYERQVSNLNRIVKLASQSSTGGFAMASLPLVQRILTLACDNIRLGHDEFIEPACGVLVTLSKPFERVRANEEFHSLDTVCDTLVVMSSIVDSPQCGHKIVITATRALKAQLEMQSLADAEGTSASVGMSTGVNRDDLRPNMWQFKQSAVLRSGMIKIIMSAFRRAVNDARESGMQSRPPTTQQRQNVLSYEDAEGTETTTPMVHLDQASSMMVGIPTGTTDGGSTQRFELVREVIAVLRELAYTKRNAEALIREGAPLVLFRALELVSSDLRNETVELSIDVLWNLLEVSSDELRKVPTASASGGSAASAAAAGLVRSRFHLLDKHRATNCLRMLGTGRVVATLRGLLERSMVEGFRARDKELRNNILVTASLLTRRLENQSHFVNTGFLSLLLLYSCAREVDLPTDANEHNFATQSEQDFELKRLMWQEIGDLCAGAAAVESNGDSATAQLVYNTIRQAPLVEALLKYLDPTGNSPDRLHWTKPQMRTLTIDACMLLLETLAVPACVQTFLDENGPVRVLQFIQQLALVDSKRMLQGNGDSNSNIDTMHSEDTMNGSGNGRGSRGSGSKNGMRNMVQPVPRTGVDPEMTIAAMRLLSRSCRLTEVGGRLGECGVMKILVALFGLNFGKNDEKTSEMKTFCSSIVADLCDPNSGIDDTCSSEIIAIEKRASVVNQKLFRRAGGVEMVRQFLDIDADELAIKGPTLTMSLVDMTWRGIVGNKRSEAIFVAEDGVDTLLNLIEHVPSSMHRQLLGCLADLMLNPSSRPYFRAWRSDANLYGAAVMCLRMWAAEEHRLGIHRGPAGVLTNLDRPLEGKNNSSNNNNSNNNVVDEEDVEDEEDEENSGGRASSRARSNANTGNEDSDFEDDAMFGASASTASTSMKPSIMSTAKQDPHALPITFPPAAKRGGTKFGRLREALAAAKDLVIFGDENQPGSDMKKIVNSCDLRIKVWSVLHSVGWDRLDMEDDDQATEAALIVLSLVNKYEDFATSKAWSDVKEEIRLKGMNPIRPDSLLIETALEKGFNLANETRYQQLKYVDVLHKKADNEEKQFYDSIRNQQEQEIQAHLVTRKMVDPRAGAKRKMKMNMK